MKTNKPLFTILISFFAFSLLAQLNYKIESYEMQPGLSPRTYASNAKKHINKGDVNLALYTAAYGLRLSEKKAINIKFHEILNDYHQLTLDNNLEEIERLKNKTLKFEDDETVTNLAKIVNLYHIMDKCNSALKLLPKNKFLPMKKKDSGLMISDFSNFKDDLAAARSGLDAGVEAAAAWHYTNANAMFEEAKRTNDKAFAKSACKRYRNAMAYVKNYEDSPQKVNEAIELGTTRLAIIDLKNNSDDFPDIDNELMDALQTALKSYNEKLEFFEIIDKSELVSGDVVLSGEIKDGSVKRSQNTSKKEYSNKVKVGTEEYKDKDGKTATRNKMETVKGTAYIERKSQKATLLASVIISAKDNRKALMEEDINGSNEWSHQWVTSTTGNKKAFPNGVIYDDKSYPTKDKAMKKASEAIATKIIAFIDKYAKEVNKVKDMDHLVSLKKEEVQTQVLSPSGFMGFNIGELIDTKSKNIKQDNIETGEGSFERYAILDNSGKTIGFIYPSEANTIFNIVITSNQYKNKEGMGVGNTFKELQDIYPNMEVHGNVMNGQISCSANDFRFLLDLDNLKTSYEVDQSTINPNAKVVEIYINTVHIAKTTIKSADGKVTTYDSAKEAFKNLKSNEILNLESGRIKLSEPIKLSNLTNISIIGNNTALVADKDMAVLRLENTKQVILSGLLVVHEIGKPCSQNCVEFISSSNITIKNCKFDGSGHTGLLLRYVDGAEITHNEFYNCTFGLSTLGSKNLTLQWNTFRDNRNSNILHSNNPKQFINAYMTTNKFK